MQKQNLLFLYLKTGNGHIAPAQYLKTEITKDYDESLVDIKICHGFGANQKFARFFFEDCYHISSAAVPGSYSLFYDINMWAPMLQLTRQIVAWHTTSYIEKLIVENDITKVVCFHFAIAGAVNRAIRRVQNKNPGKKIPFIIAVTDPFTAHPSWFLEKNADFIVFSDQLKSEVESKYGITKVKKFPFILNPVFGEKIAENEKKPQTDVPFINRYCADCINNTKNSLNSKELLKSLVKCLNGTEKPFLTVVAGGGEGLPDMASLVHCFLEKASNCSVKDKKQDSLILAVVCGRNKTDFLRLRMLQNAYPDIKLFVFGYIDFMPDLLKMSDCVVTKAGASMIMEILACHKPLIISTYIHGQELGNVRFVVNNGCGFFIRKPEDIFNKLIKMSSDEIYYGSVKRNLEKLNVKPDTKQLAEYIYNL